MEFTNKNQFNAFLKKEAKRLNMGINETYITFFARDFLQRLNKYNTNIILVKGSSAELSYLNRPVRAITDIDLAGLASYKKCKPIIMNAMTDKDISPYKYSFVKNEYTTKTGIIKLSLAGRFLKTNQHLGIDFEQKYRRLITPEVRMMPAIFEGDEPFEVFVPSFEEYLAEKLCIIAESNKPEVLNTRVKDFYDIFQLHGGDYSTKKLTEYFGIILKKRGKIKMEDIDTRLLNEDFIERHSALWNKIREKYGFLDKEISLAGAVYYTRGILREQLHKYNLTMPDNITRSQVKVKRRK